MYVLKYWIAICWYFLLKRTHWSIEQPSVHTLPEHVLKHWTANLQFSLPANAVTEAGAICRLFLCSLLASKCTEASKQPSGWYSLLASACTSTEALFSLPGIMLCLWSSGQFSPSISQRENTTPPFHALTTDSKHSDHHIKIRNGKWLQHCWILRHRFSLQCKEPCSLQHSVVNQLHSLTTVAHMHAYTYWYPCII